MPPKSMHRPAHRCMPLMAPPPPPISVLSWGWGVSHWPRPPPLTRPLPPTARSSASQSTSRMRRAQSSPSASSSNGMTPAWTGMRTRWDVGGEPLGWMGCRSPRGVGGGHLSMCSHLMPCAQLVSRGPSQWVTSAIRGPVPTCQPFPSHLTWVAAPLLTHVPLCVDVCVCLCLFVYPCVCVCAHVHVGLCPHVRVQVALRTREL